MRNARYTTLKGLFGILLGTAITFSATAQQDPIYSQYQFNTMAINPGYAGSVNDAISFVALHRSQWTGFEGAPTTQTFLVHSPIKTNMGLGLSIINDQIGPTQQTGFFADYSYRLQIDSKTDLRLGLKAGGTLFSADLTDIALDQADDIAFSNNVSGEFLPNFGFGLFWDSEKYYIGASIPKLRRNEIGSEVGATSISEESIFNQKRHIFLLGGYTMDLNEDVQFKPSFVFKSTGNSPASLDLSLNFSLKSKVWVGMNYRFGDAIGGVVQYLFTDYLRAGYSYDYTLSNIGSYSSGTHEIMLRYDLKRKKSAPNFDPSNPTGNDGPTIDPRDGG